MRKQRYRQSHRLENACCFGARPAETNTRCLASEETFGVFIQKRMSESPKNPLNSKSRGFTSQTSGRAKYQTSAILLCTSGFSIKNVRKQRYRQSHRLANARVFGARPTKTNTRYLVSAEGSSEENFGIFGQKGMSEYPSKNLNLKSKGLRSP